MSIGEAQLRLKTKAGEEVQSEGLESIHWAKYNQTMDTENVLKNIWRAQGVGIKGEPSGER